VILDIDQLRKRITTRQARVVAIDGCGGSGKSTLARRLAEVWPGAAVVEMDDFYRPSAERDRRPGIHGGDYDRERLVAEVLEPHASGRGGRYRRYDWDEDRLAEWHQVAAGAPVVLDGVYSSSELLRPYLDYTIWVDCPYDLRLQRGIERDGEGMRSTWVQDWMSAEDRYVEADQPQKRVDLVIDGSVA
jgi:uridine kinase